MNFREALESTYRIVERVRLICLTCNTVFEVPPEGKPCPLCKVMTYPPKDRPATAQKRKRKKR